MTSAAWVPTKTKLPTEAGPEAQWSRVIQFPLLGTWPVGVFQKVLRLEELPEGWDGQDSPAIQSAAIEGALRMLASVRVEGSEDPSVVPVPGGGVQLEWRVGGRDLEIEFLPDGSLQYLLCLGRDRFEEGNLVPGDSESVCALFDALRR